MHACPCPGCCVNLCPVHLGSFQASMTVHGLPTPPLPRHRSMLTSHVCAQCTVCLHVCVYMSAQCMCAPAHVCAPCIVCLCVCTQCMYVPIRVCTVCLCACTCFHSVCACACVCTVHCVPACAPACVCLCACTCVRSACVCLRVCLHMCACACVYAQCTDKCVSL